MDDALNNRWAERLGGVGLAAVLTLLSGCFSEPPASPATTTDATGGPCNPGSELCECSDGTCLDGLVCNPSNVCMREDCVAGSPGCECVSGLCDPGLECRLGMCFPDTPDTTTTAGTTTTPPTSTTSTSTTSSESSNTDASTTSGSSSSGDPEPCHVAMQCEDCVSCTNTGECSDEVATCMATGNCFQNAQCMSVCAAEGLCFENCCGGSSQAERDAAQSLHLCRVNTCLLGDMCTSFADPICDP